MTSLMPRLADRHDFVRCWAIHPLDCHRSLHFSVYGLFLHFHIIYAVTYSRFEHFVVEEHQAGHILRVVFIFNRSFRNKAIHAQYTCDPACLLLFYFTGICVQIEMRDFSSPKAVTVDSQLL